MVSARSARSAATLLREALNILEQVRSILEPAVDEAEHEDVGERILGEILRRGGTVTRHELYALAEQHGMDRRGLGGFFRQSGKTSLYELPGTDKVVLTPYGAEQARRFVERKTTYVYGEDSTMTYAKIAEASFAEDWGSDEDLVYDAL